MSGNGQLSMSVCVWLRSAGHRRYRLVNNKTAISNVGGVVAGIFFCSSMALKLIKRGDIEETGDARQKNGVA